MRAITFPFLILFMVACGATAAQRAMNVTLAGLNTARDGFHKYDEDTQEQIIVQHAGHKDEARSAIATYRSEVKVPVLQAFVVAYSALAVAASDHKASNIALMLSAAAAVYQIVQTLTPSTTQPATVKGPIS